MRRVGRGRRVERKEAGKGGGRGSDSRGSLIRGMERQGRVDRDEEPPLLLYLYSVRGGIGDLHDDQSSHVYAPADL